MTEKPLLLTDCPCCGAIWSIEEMDWEECDCFGYPNNELDDDDDSEWDVYDDDDDDPNDSRNL